MPLTQVTEFASAKVNLTLHVTGQRADGYHLLDSLVVFCGIGDVLQAALAEKLTLTLTGPFAPEIPPGDGNLVLRAARQFAGDMGVAFTLAKHLPPASGIGGGSADAAAAIRAVLRLHSGIGGNAAGEKIDAGKVLGLGADVPVCLASAPARMRGIGDMLTPINALPEIYIALVNPRVAVPTPAVFSALATRQNPAMPDDLPNWPDARALAKWLKTQRNDLQPAAVGIAPVISDVLRCIAAQPDALIARMSGSGATCFGLFETEAAATTAVDAIGAAYPNWWAASGQVHTWAVA